MAISKDQKEVEKKEEENPEIILKVDMHCEACARKVARTLRGFEGYIFINFSSFFFIFIIWSLKYLTDRSGGRCDR